MGSFYLGSGIGVKATKNLNLLQTLASVLFNLHGRWIIGGDFNCTLVELEATGWSKLVGDISLPLKRPPAETDSSTSV